MQKELIVRDNYGNNVLISVVGGFRIPDLEKEYIIYSLEDDDDSNKSGTVLIGEVVDEENGMNVVGIPEEEKDIVLAFYKEISDSLGV